MVTNFIVTIISPLLDVIKYFLNLIKNMVYVHFTLIMTGLIYFLAKEGHTMIKTLWIGRKEKIPYVFIESMQKS